MKIAIPADAQSMDSAVCPSFGRAPYYLIVDTKTEAPVFLKNPASASQGGAGVLASQFLVDQDIQAVVTPRCGRNAAQVIEAAGIGLYRSQAGTLQDNLKSFIDGNLDRLEEIHAGFHRHGGS